MYLWVYQKKSFQSNFFEVNYAMYSNSKHKQTVSISLHTLHFKKKLENFLANHKMIK